MRSATSQFIAPPLLALLCLASFGFKGILAEEYAHSRGINVEHRLDDFGNQPEPRDHHNGHGHASHGNSEGQYPSISEDQYKRPKPAHFAPKPQYRPLKSTSLPSKALHQPLANRPSAYSPSAYKPASYTPPSHSPPAYNPPAYKPPAYSPPAYNSPTYTPPAYTPASYELPAYIESSTYQPPAHSSTSAYPSTAYSAALPSEPEYPYNHIPETNKGGSKGASFNSDFPNFDDFVQQSIKFDQFKI